MCYFKSHIHFMSQSMFPRFSGENFEKNKNLYKKLASLAEKHACTTTPQLALAWLLHQGGDIVPIPGNNQTLL